VHAIRNKTAEVGIVADSVGLDGLEQKRFREDWLIAVVPAAHPLAAREHVAFDEIVDADFIGLTAAHCRSISPSRRVRSASESATVSS
jgi:DNA-binding transcriptional LysR family regulator